LQLASGSPHLSFSCLLLRCQLNWSLGRSDPMLLDLSNRLAGSFWNTNPAFALALNPSRLAQLPLVAVHSGPFQRLTFFSPWCSCQIVGVCDITLLLGRKLTGARGPNALVTWFPLRIVPRRSFFRKLLFENDFSYRISQRAAVFRKLADSGGSF